MKIKEPILMPFQNLPFNGDHFIEKEFLKLKKRFNIKIAIETGSCLFSTTIWLAKNFDLVFTIESNEEYRNIGLKKIQESNNIVSFLGKSEDVLPEILKKINKWGNIMFFLDAHWGELCPLKSELNVIAKYIANPVISIHDFKVPDEPELGYDSYGGEPICFEWLKEDFDKIYGNNNYGYHFNSDKKSTEIKRGIIYLHPNQCL